MNTIKTTITLNPQTFTRLKTFTTRNNYNMSQVIETGINQVIDEVEKDRPQKMWAHLKKMKGAGKASNPELAQQSVDEILYGDNGAWRGSEL